ncbi:MAG: GAF domain-containing SpoIIE family protein phosphatase [Bryobacterales bacterium]
MDLEFRIKRLEAENERLKRAVEELSILNDVALAVSSTLALNEIVDLIVQKSVKHLRVEQGAVLLIDKREEEAPMRTMIRRAQSDSSGIPYRLGDQITGWMLKNQQALVVNDLTTDGRFRVPPEASTMRSLLCVPLRLKGRMIGVLTVFNKHGGEPFTEGDSRLLTIIGAQSAQVIENARLYEEEQALARIEQELDTARTIQERLLPKAPPAVPGYDLAGRSKPARQVGGDYFDYLSRVGRGTVLCLADVSGKGISAALLMANIQAAIRSLSLSDDSLAKNIQHANQLLYNSTTSDKFATMFYAALDAERNELSYSNAGHNPPLLISSAGEVRELTEGGPVLGILPSFPYEQASVSLAPGEVLLIYSDGFSEAANARFDEFGEQRLRELAVELRAKPAEKIIEAIVAEVQTFCGDAPQSDDMTIVVVRRES